MVSIISLNPPLEIREVDENSKMPQKGSGDAYLFRLRQRERRLIESVVTAAGLFIVIFGAVISFGTNSSYGGYFFTTAALLVVITMAIHEGLHYASALVYDLSPNFNFYPVSIDYGNLWERPLRLAFVSGAPLVGITVFAGLLWVVFPTSIGVYAIIVIGINIAISSDDVVDVVVFYALPDGSSVYIGPYGDGKAVTFPDTFSLQELRLDTE